MKSLLDLGFSLANTIFVDVTIHNKIFSSYAIYRIGLSPADEKPASEFNSNSLV